MAKKVEVIFKPNYTKHIPLKKGYRADYDTKRALLAWDDGKITAKTCIFRLCCINEWETSPFENVLDFYVWADSLGYLRMHDRVQEEKFKGHVNFDKDKLYRQDVVKDSDY